eukprot:4984036-Prymnesium_polylepis.1
MPEEDLRVESREDALAQTHRAARVWLGHPVERLAHRRQDVIRQRVHLEVLGKPCRQLLPAQRAAVVHIERRVQVAHARGRLARRRLLDRALGGLAADGDRRHRLGGLVGHVVWRDAGGHVRSERERAARAGFTVLRCAFQEGRCPIRTGRHVSPDPS